MKESLGLGMYRMSSRSQKHAKALNQAISSGVIYIDTSVNYMGGESEKLLGQLKEGSGRDVYSKNDLKIISKVGYVQGDLLDEIRSLPDYNKMAHEVYEFSEHHAHSINAHFISYCLSQSLERMKRNKIHAYLLHNPEYLLEKISKEHFFKLLCDALFQLQNEVDQGRIEFFGISSNLFPLADDRFNLHILNECVKNVEAKCGRKIAFKYVQMPFNLIENDALLSRPIYGGLNTFDKAHQDGYTVMSNRPLNAIANEKLLRLAFYDVKEDQIKLWPTLLSEVLIELKERYLKLLSQEVIDTSNSFEELPMVDFLKNKIEYCETIDAVETFFFKDFFPFVAQLFGRDLTSQESQKYYQLFEVRVECAKRALNVRLEKVFQYYVSKNILSIEKKENLPHSLLEMYLSQGVDIVLMGMRDPHYVDKMMNQFN